MKVCIIGSGFGGYILAKKLSSKKNFKISLFDINNLQSEKNKNLKINYSRDHNISSDKLQFHGFGGGSNVWHGVITKFDEMDILNIKKNNNIDLHKNYKKFEKDAFKFLGINSNFNFKSESFKKINILNRLLKNKFLKTKKFIIQKKPKKILNDLKKLKNLDNVQIFENNCVVNFVFNNKKNKVVGIESVNLQNKKKEKNYFDLFILSAGALETPRLLYQSLQNKKYKFRKDLFNNFSDHYKTVIGKFKYNFNYDKQLNNNFDIFLNKTDNLRIGFTPNNCKNFQNFCIIFRRVPNKKYLEFILCLKEFLKKKNIETIIKLIKKFNAKYLIYLFNRLLFKKYPYSNDIAEIWTSSTKIKKNKLIFSNNKKDKIGRLLPIVKYKISSHEIQQIRKAQEILLNEFKSGDAISFKILKINKKNISSASHFNSTCLVGNNSKKSIVNKNLKFHGINNLYICDNSILNFTGNSNPTFSLIIYSLRLADHLIKKILKVY